MWPDTPVHCLYSVARGGGYISICNTTPARGKFTLIFMPVTWLICLGWFWKETSETPQYCSATTPEVTETLQPHPTDIGRKQRFNWASVIREQDVCYVRQLRSTKTCLIELSINWVPMLIYSAYALSISLRTSGDWATQHFLMVFSPQMWPIYTMGEKV